MCMQNTIFRPEETASMESMLYFAEISGAHAKRSWRTGAEKPKRKCKLAHNNHFTTAFDVVLGARKN